MLWIVADLSAVDESRGLRRVLQATYRCCLLLLPAIYPCFLPRSAPRSIAINLTGTQKDQRTTCLLPVQCFILQCTAQLGRSRISSKAIEHAACLTNVQFINDVASVLSAWFRYLRFAYARSVLFGYTVAVVQLSSKYGRESARDSLCNRRRDRCRRWFPGEFVLLLVPLSGVQAQPDFLPFLQPPSEPYLQAPLASSIFRDAREPAYRPGM